MNSTTFFFSFFYHILAKYEIVKAQTMKTKLESLCRELQKENKRTKVLFYFTFLFMYWQNINSFQKNKN